MKRIAGFAFAAAFLLGGAARGARADDLQEPSFADAAQSLAAIAGTAAGLRTRFSAGNQAAAQDSALPSLRQLAESRGKWIGSAVAVNPLGADTKYADFLGGQFDIVTPENAMKFAPVHPRPGTDASAYDFSGADQIVRFAQAHGQRVRGHTLVWHNQLPDWLTSQTYAPDQLSGILRNHIETVIGHFKGEVYCWDVVNEAVAPDGSMRQTIWSALGPDYIANAFRWARAADPSAKLFYNDYGAESSPKKARAILALISDLKSKGVPIDGVGLQTHLTAGENYGDFGDLIRSFAALGVEVQITEADVATGSPETPAQLTQQADLYKDVLSACLTEPSCTAFVMWGFTDKYSWKASQSPLILDANYAPKPAYEAVRGLLAPAAAP